MVVTIQAGFAHQSREAGPPLEQVGGPVVYLHAAAELHPSQRRLQLVLNNLVLLGWMWFIITIMQIRVNKCLRDPGSCPRLMEHNTFKGLGYIIGP